MGRNPPALRESDLKKLKAWLEERYPLSHLMAKSYVLSRFWAWWSQVQVDPKLRVPVPRFLTQRDP